MSAKQSQVKEQMLKMSARLDGLHRNQTMNKMQLRNIQNQIKQKIELAQLNNVINLQEMGLNENVVMEL